MRRGRRPKQVSGVSSAWNRLRSSVTCGPPVKVTLCISPSCDPEDRGREIGRSHEGGEVWPKRRPVGGSSAGRGGSEYLSEQEPGQGQATSPHSELSCLISLHIQDRAPGEELGERAVRRESQRIWKAGKAPEDYQSKTQRSKASTITFQSHEYRRAQRVVVDVANVHEEPVPQCNNRRLNPHGGLREDFFLS